MQNIVVTGSSGHLGEALVLTLRGNGRKVRGMDLKQSPSTDRVGSICDRDFVRDCLSGADAVIHCATLHKPHVGTHSREEFIRTNVIGTLNLLEEAADARVGAFVYSSTTSAFGLALSPPPDAPAAWITEEVVPQPKNIYGVSKTAAEDLCELFARRGKLPSIVLRVSRFFPEPDDDPLVRGQFEPLNIQANELLFRRIDLSDAVDAHLCALRRAKDLKFGKYIVSATTPFSRSDAAILRRDPDALVARLHANYRAVYRSKNWRMFNQIDRVYDNSLARRDLGWKPRHDFAHALEELAEGRDFRSKLALQVGSKGYHETEFDDGPYPLG